MAVKNAPAAVARALKSAATLSHADLSRVIEDIDRQSGPSDALLAQAYVEGIYLELAGEDRRYLTSKLKALRDGLFAQPATPDAPPPAAA